MPWRRFSTSCSFYSLTVHAMRPAGVAHSSFLDCVLRLQAAACGLVLCSAGGGKWPKGAFRNSSGSQKDSTDPTVKVHRRHQHLCLCWSLSGFAQHVSATHLPSANLQGDWKEMCFHGEKKNITEVMTGKACFMEMDISWHRDGYSANSTLHDHKPFTFPKVSSEFGFLTSLQHQFSSKTYQSRIISTIKPIACKYSYVPSRPMRVREDK